MGINENDSEKYIKRTWNDNLQWNCNEENDYGNKHEWFLWPYINI